MANEILKTQNEEHGFWGTTALHYTQKQTQKRWNDVFDTLLELSGAGPEKIREFLDDRIGRLLADQCYKEKDVKQITKKCYFEWLDKILFEDENNKKTLETDKSSILFGEKVYNRIYDRVDILLYTYKNKNRNHEDYALCMTPDLKQYRVGMDYIIPLNELSEDELAELHLNKSY